MVNAVRLTRQSLLRPFPRARILAGGGTSLGSKRTGTTMYRVFAIVVGGLALAACTSSPSWMNLDALKPQPITDTVRFESEPPGADAKVSNGQTCKTPCSLSLPASGAYTVQFSLAGYQPEADSLELVSMGDGSSRLRPNPVLVELTPAPPQAKKPPAKKPAPRKKTTAKKPAPAAKPTTQAAPAQSAPPPPPAQTQQGTSPWPSAPAGEPPK
jgi:PEGA domain-containing protein